MCTSATISRFKPEYATYPRRYTNHLYQFVIYSGSAILEKGRFLAFRNLLWLELPLFPPVIGLPGHTE